MTNDSKCIPFFSESVISDEDILKTNIPPTEDVWILVEIKNLGVKDYLCIGIEVSDYTIGQIVDDWAETFAHAADGDDDPEDLMRDESETLTTSWSRVKKIPVEWVEAKVKEIRGHIAELEKELAHVKKAPQG